MTVHQMLAKGTLKLKNHDIGTARLDALILLEDVTGIERASLLATPETQISPEQTEELENLLKRRAQQEPLAYVRGKTEFYGREFVINRSVLEPRPESETMIDELKRLPDLPAQPSIADVGTGSGALGITAKLELPQAEVDLIDTDPECLKVAKVNVDKFTLNIDIIESDLLKESETTYDVLACNLPYVPDDYQINTAALHEPRLAIFGGTDGLDLYRRLFKQVEQQQEKPLYILTESLPFQHEALTEIAEAKGYAVSLENDFILVFRRAK